MIGRFYSENHPSLEGIFERKDGSMYWLDCMDDYEMANAKYLCLECAGVHQCEKTILNDDMDGYVDTLQNEEELSDNELYVVTYEHAFLDCGYWNLEGLVDFGITKQQIIENVKAQKYVEGATYYTMGQMFYATKMIMEDMENL